MSIRRNRIVISGGAKRLAATVSVLLTLHSVAAAADESAEPAGENSLGMKFVRIAPGQYKRGFDTSDRNERRFSNRGCEANDKRPNEACQLDRDIEYEVGGVKVPSVVMVNGVDAEK